MRREAPQRDTSAAISTKESRKLSSRSFKNNKKSKAKKKTKGDKKKKG